MMDTEIIELTSAARRMKFVLPGEAVGKEMNDITRKMAKSASLPGFRKGKVPFAVIRRKYSDKIKNDAIMSLVGERLKNELAERAIAPLEQPYLENFSVDEDSNDHEITIAYEVMPEVDNPSLAGEEIIRPVLEFSEADLDTIIGRWQELYQAWEAVERPVELHDRVSARVEAFENGRSTWGAAQKIDFQIDGKDESREVKDACVGKSIGEEFSVEVTHEIPQSSEGGEHDQAPEMLTKQMEYQVEIVKIERPLPGQMTEQFLEHLGVSGSDDDNFRVQARVEIERQCQAQLDSSLRSHMSALLLLRNKFTPPRVLVLRQMLQSLKIEGWDDKTLAKWIGQPESPEFAMRFTNAAAEMKLMLTLDQVQKDRQIAIEDSELESYIEKEYGNIVESLETTAENPDVVYQFKQSKAAEYRHIKLLDSLLTDATVSEVAMGLDEFEKWLADMRKYLDSPIDADDESNAEPDAQEPVSEKSMIVDASGNPIDKSSIA